MKIRVASLFAGCGGLDYGFHHNNQYQTVYVNDIDKYACKTYEKNFGVKPECQDISKVENIPDCDLLIGGFPCQGFSIANPYRSVEDKRNRLYLEILRILRLKQPKMFILENVKGILNLEKGEVFARILEDLRECGYEVNFQLFKFKEYGIPQKRERVIIYGRQGHPPIMGELPKTEKEKTLRDAIGDLPLECDPERQHIGTKHKPKVTGYLGNRELKWEDPSPTITGRGGGTGGPVIHNHPSMARRLTVRECARIQTFPDDFEFVGSVTSMFRQIGNAVPPLFSTLLATAMLENFLD